MGRALRYTGAVGPNGIVQTTRASREGILGSALKCFNWYLGDRKLHVPVGGST